MNLALDEALLTEAGGGQGEVIRFWRFDRTVVVLGRGSKRVDEVNVAFCEAHSIDVLRRCSGGASIVAGPDCLMYSVVLDLRLRPELRNVDVAHRFVMQKLASAITRQNVPVELRGICDLTIDGKKFSGNALRIARDFLLYHGTVLERVDPVLVQSCLRTAPRQPAYREGREHDAFVTSVPVDPIVLCDDLATSFGATGELPRWPVEPARELYGTKYGTDAWHQRH